ncbi:MAG: DUF488 domain-containing protein [Proteobacteria bacterium]|nr:DUF488 domain-containing protein [Pseudomonadota bacterium]MDA1311539.1 DUF488 domain-containing protein [Pseudomonadota bacterium]
MPSPVIKLKRVYEPPASDDGLRILVERLWPRGLTKADVALDHWIKDVAPSSALRTWFGHRVERWDEFQQRYRGELADNAAAIDELTDRRAGGPVTFLYAAKDTERNGAVVLREFLMSNDK